jgi:hypothetical protein
MKKDGTRNSIGRKSVLTISHGHKVSNNKAKIFPASSILMYTPFQTYSILIEDGLGPFMNTYVYVRKTYTIEMKNFRITASVISCQRLYI